ncbi:MAG: DUF4160 domain-containing protein [Campylobacterota bacterium]|nr:DUF4160 domain-containing protein [Campylobacterota bacterium]
MPEVSRFLGINITFNYDEHNPPHFHAKYGEYNGLFLIKELRMSEGDLPKKVKNLILEWADDHREELMEDWNLAREEQPLKKIKPLV